MLASIESEEYGKPDLAIHRSRIERLTILAKTIEYMRKSVKEDVDLQMAGFTEEEWLKATGFAAIRKTAGDAIKNRRMLDMIAQRGRDLSCPIRIGAKAWEKVDGVSLKDLKDAETTLDTFSLVK